MSAEQVNEAVEAILEKAGQEFRDLSPNDYGEVLATLVDHFSVSLEALQSEEAESSR